MNKAGLFLMISMMVLSGCAESTALIKANSTSIRTDVYEELTNGGIVSQGFVNLRITATLKTHKPGIYSASDIHGTPDYKLLLNIDGQVLLLRGSIQKENSEPRGLNDPEAGDGIRYRFSNNLRLKAGTHRIVVALPDDGIAIEREINLVEGNVNNLVIKPIYSATPGNKRPASYNNTSFMKGIIGYGLTLNGREI